MRSSKLVLSKRTLFIVILCAVMVSACKTQKSEKPANPKIDKLKLTVGFKAEHLYSPEEHEQGSWVAMTFDSKGRMITADQYGAIYRIIIPAIGDTTKPIVEKLVIGTKADRDSDTTTLKVGMGFAQGLLYAFNSLYVMVNHNSDKNFNKNTGMYRLQDTDGDDQFDKVTLLKSFEGEPGEHGPHSMILSPDKKSIYIAAGNHVDVPKFDTYRLPPVWAEDNLLPQIKDPRGHATTRMAPGGWIAHTDSLGKKWELVSAGFRNQFDLTFNDAGDLFTYDSDMEWDFGMPWYRPTRICHVTSGSEFGWRTGNGVWTEVYPDNLPPVINIGQGSPTNFMNGSSARFPEKYRNSLFAFDWSFGIIYAVHLKPEGASYSADVEEFLSGEPLPLTDGAIGPDGAMYFLTGGRRLESDLYRITAIEPQEPAHAETKITDANQLRRNLEKLHEPNKTAVATAWPNLKNEDRFVRYAARLAVENQPVTEWQDRALKETDPQSLIQAMIALAHHGKPALRDKMIDALVKIDFSKLSASQKTDLARTFELIVLRTGKPEGAAKNNLISYLNPHYPSSSNNLDRILSKVLVSIGSPDVVQKTLAILDKAKDEEPMKTVTSSSDLIMRNPQYGMDIAKMLSNVPPAQQTWLATALCEASIGWTPELHEKYFKWFANAFTYKGGLSYIGFIDKARKKALTHTDADKTTYYDKLSGAGLVSESGNELVDNRPQPKGPGRHRSREEALALVDGALYNRNFENGKNMFNAVLCSSCHSMRGEGGAIGPDLTQVGTRFSAKDILENTLDPNKEISDQYAATVFEMKDGSSIVGRLINEENGKYFVSQNPFTPNALREISKADVVSTKLSTVSLMLPGLLGGLNDEEIKDLVAYMVAGGNPDHEVFKDKPSGK